MSNEQGYYSFLARTDHPVFARDFSICTTVASPLNSIYNRVFAKQMVVIRALLDQIYLNQWPQTVTALTINDWEAQYFGFTKPSLPLPQRVSELLIAFNKHIGMTVSDVISLAQSIVGATPIVTRNATYYGWTLGKSYLGINTTFQGTTTTEGLYLVNFTKPVDSGLLAKLDQALTAIQKAGSMHVMTAPRRYWILGTSSLGIDTTL